MHRIRDIGNKIDETNRDVENSEGKKVACIKLPKVFMYQS